MDEDDEFDDSPVIPKLKTYKEAINSLEDTSLPIFGAQRTWN